jgi:hypothetical protein
LSLLTPCGRTHRRWHRSPVASEPHCQQSMCSPHRVPLGDATPIAPPLHSSARSENRARRARFAGSEVGKCLTDSGRSADGAAGGQGNWRQTPGALFLCPRSFVLIPCATAPSQRGDPRDRRSRTRTKGLRAWVAAALCHCVFALNALARKETQRLGDAKAPGKTPVPSFAPLSRCVFALNALASEGNAKARRRQGARKNFSSELCVLR